MLLNNICKLLSWTTRCIKIYFTFNFLFISDVVTNICSSYILILNPFQVLYRAFQSLNPYQMPYRAPQLARMHFRRLRQRLRESQVGLICKPLTCFRSDWLKTPFERHLWDLSGFSCILDCSYWPSNRSIFWIPVLPSRL